MTPRTILYTGKGGVGKTSVAAATARRCAAQGLRTIVLSTDPAHSLSDALKTEIGPEPTKLGPGLWAQEVSARAEMVRHWSAVQDWFGDLLIGRGVDRISAEELSVPPGMDELFSLLAIQDHHRSGSYDVIVVDCAPTGETLRLLAFPDVARWWLERVFPQQGRLLDAVRPLARSILDISLPGISGWETAVQIRERIQQDFVIIMASANSQEFHRPEHHKPVHDHFFVKPYRLDQMAEAIGGLLQLTWKWEALGPAEAPAAPGEEAMPAAARPHVCLLYTSRCV